MIMADFPRYSIFKRALKEQETHWKLIVAFPMNYSNYFVRVVKPKNNRIYKYLKINMRSSVIFFSRRPIFIRQ